MIDIHFYMGMHDLKKRITAGEKFDREYLWEQFEGNRRKDPVVYNIETTNACNMKCRMCPRTTMMTRKVEPLDQETFDKIARQLKSFTNTEWNSWKSFAEKEYGIREDEVSENNFFLYIIPKVIQLHGYGDPLLDSKMVTRVGNLKKRGLWTYFSCNPSNINVEKNIELFETGLDYIKYSIEAVDDEEHKRIRGSESNFTDSYRNILKLLDEKEKRGLETVIVITMLDLRCEKQLENYDRLKKAFEGLKVYLYLKSQDQQWYEGKNQGTKSIHWSEICQHPWMSMTVKSNAEVVMCMEDFNNEIILGDARRESLPDIWNGARYEKFRRDQFNLTGNIKCIGQCDMKLIGNFIK
jgi:MoaA/NifB/PqqE/SkfB family radical SAM enzyme